MFMVLAGLALARNAAASTTVDGVTGILKTPTAEVVQEGSVEFTLARHLSTLIRFEGGTVARVYSATVGYLPGLEVTASINEFPEIPDVENNVANLQDRSVSLKYRFFQDEDWMLAGGALDAAGESKIQTSYYGVATYTGLDDVQLSAGFGTDNLEGAFGSLKWSPDDHVSLLGEYDTEDFNYGVELRPFKGLSLKGGMASDHGAFTASYTIPMDPRGRDTPCCPVALERCEVEYADPCELAAAVRDALTEESFENVLVGSDGEMLYIEYENRRFREQVDGLAVAAATAVRASGPGITRLALAPKIEDVPQVLFSADVADFVAFLADPYAAPPRMHAGRYYPGSYPAATQFAPEGNKSPGHGDIDVRITTSVNVNQENEPAFRTKAGPGLEETIHLARSFALKARQDWPAFNDINDKTDPVNRSALLTYLDSWAPGLFGHAAGGYLGGEQYGGKGELGYFFEPGRFKLSGHYAYINDENDDSDPEDGLALGELAYYQPELDLELKVQGGRFIEATTGSGCPPRATSDRLS